MNAVPLQQAVRRSGRDIPYQAASLDIWDKKYRLKTKGGEIIDPELDDTYARIARALAEVELPEKRELWFERFLWTLRNGAIPAGRIISNAGALEHKPATSTINCTVSGTVPDSMDGILSSVHEAGLTLKAGCVAPGTWVVTEKGLVTADQAVAERHASILCYDRSARRFEMRCIQRHLTTRVPRAKNIEIVSNGVSLKTSVRHPVLVYRNDELVYVRADEVGSEDALVHHRFAWSADSAQTLPAWFSGAHPGDGSAYEKRFQYRATRQRWRERARAAGARLIFKIRAAEREVVERCGAFLREFCGARARVVAAATVNGTPVWDDTVASFAASAAARLIDRQTGEKSHTLRVPGWIKAQPQRHFLPFLAGLIDTDGTVSSETGSATLATQSFPFAEELRDLLGVFGVHGGITRRAARDHSYRGRLVRDRGGAALKISDSAFLGEVARYMADGAKRRRILDSATRSGRYDRYVLPRALQNALVERSGGLNHRECQRLGFYHGYHLARTVSRIWLDRWQERFPELGTLIGFARTLRPVDEIRRALPLSEIFYDFTVERHNNYLAGNRGLMVIHNCGIGYEFSTLRPKGAFVSGAGAYTSGPLSFMDIFDAMCFTVMSAGGRRGAQMGTFDIAHPDVMEFIRAKRENGRLRQFNLSCLITDEFMQAVRENAPWELVFPATHQEYEDEKARIVWRSWPTREGYIGNELGQVACKVYKTIPARRLWDLIMASTYDYAEPGFILIDRINEMNNNWFCENIRATNPCGEQPLPPYGSCWTGDMRLNTNYGLIKTEDAYDLVQKGLPLNVGVDDTFSGNKTDLRPCALVCNGERDVFEVRLDNSQHIKLTADHRVYTPQGWREVHKLQRGDAVHVQSKELAGLDLIPPFYLGVLKYLFSSYDGDEIVVTRRNRRAFLRPILDQLRVNYTDRARGLFVSRHHLVVRDVERLELAGAPRAALEGYAYAAQATAAHYKERAAIYGEREHCERLARVLRQLAGREFVCTHHKKNTYRLSLPALAIDVPVLERPAIDLDYAVYGWLLADGWLTSSTGILFSDQDDVAMRVLAPHFQVMTGTEGALRKTYEGRQRTVYTLACYGREAVSNLRKALGLNDYTSKNVRVPERVFRADAAQQASFLAAVFCADGSVHPQKPLVRLTSASKAWLEDMQLLLLNFGIHGVIHASVSKGNAFYSLNLNQRDAYRYYRYVGFPFSSHKQVKLERLLSEKERWHAPSSEQTAYVTEIRPLGKQRVYDIEEFTTHTLIVNGVVVHNCLLGSINLTRFVEDPFSDNARFDWQRYREVVRVFTRMLDNVVEINGLPLAKQRHEITHKRRHGMGFLGLGSALTLLKMKYGAPESLEFTERVTREMAEAGWEVGVELAEEKGPAPIMNEEFTVTEELLARRPEMGRDGYRAGDRVPGRVLLARYSRYMQQFDSSLSERIARVGARFTHHTSIAPTGTISLSLGNNASNGIEPSFAHKYSRNVIREGRKTKERVDVYSFELLAYRLLVDPAADPEATDPAHRLPEYFAAADEVTPRQHVDIQAAAQKWVDSSISKTANVPTDFPYEEFKNIYMYAYEKGLKGCTTFRFNPAAFQGVLVKERDLENTTYRFTLANGEVVEVKGNEDVEYDGETHTAANLYDALKEGYYGRF